LNFLLYSYKIFIICMIIYCIISLLTIKFIKFIKRNNNIKFNIEKILSLFSINILRYQIRFTIASNSDSSTNNTEEASNN